MDAAAPDTSWGLSSQEAARRLQRDGPNELPDPRYRSGLASALEVAGEPMLLLLVVCVLLYFALGDMGEAALLSVAVVLIIGIDYVQERRTERALQALRDLSSPRALVLRDGVLARVSGREVVVGDILILSEGDRVAADAAVLESTDMALDESLLTGESVPVAKGIWSGAPDWKRPGGDGLPFVYAGTMIVRGHGKARVLRTGAATEMGRIGKALAALEPKPSPLQREMREWVRLLAGVGVLVSLAVAVLRVVRGGSWTEGVLAGLALAMSLIPEELPVVLAIFLALGAWRISRRRVLTRKPASIETLGTITVLCADKTGTLTQNRMAVRRLWAAGEQWEIGGGSLDEPFSQLLHYAILASRRDSADPMEHALRELSGKNPWAGLNLVKDFPPVSGRPAAARIWESQGAGVQVAAIKGAPETLVGLCLGGFSPDSVLEAVSGMGREGLRVLAVARGEASGASAESLEDFRFVFLGLVAFEDPVRPTSRRAVEESRKAGIRILMVTGDHPETALSIARQSGIDATRVATGSELASLDAPALRRLLRECSVFARVHPEHKLLIVETLKAAGEIVAMTGDGINDAPALQAAHVGIAMGGRGTDVAREAAAIVILNDDLAVIVEAIRNGREVFENIRKASRFILAVHLPIAGLALLPAALGWPLFLMPPHVVFLELVIDPVCTMVFAADERAIDPMGHPPRRPGEPLLDRATVREALRQGIGVLAISILAYAWGLYAGWSAAAARTAAFSGFVLAVTAMVAGNLAWDKSLGSVLRNAAFRWVLGVAGVILALVLAMPQLRALFHFEAPGNGQIALACVAGLSALLWIRAATRRDISHNPGG
ncbi:MAG: cation-translocating P-type ATPase [Elusimicrobia bacterium]|nr:cation-translocating P-type ATPase [Elusimicrobiota bacterium]